VDKIDQIRRRKGQFTKVKFSSAPKPAAASKGRVLEKITTGTFRLGLNYANLGAVKEGIEAGERGEVQSLPWGQWVEFPILIQHKGKQYARLYPVHARNDEGILVPKVDSLQVTYMVDGQQVDRESFLWHLPPSQRQSKSSDCVTVALENLEIL
jgi:hypothetical protein